MALWKRHEPRPDFLREERRWHRRALFLRRRRRRRRWTGALLALLAASALLLGGLYLYYEHPGLLPGQGEDTDADEGRRTIPVPLERSDGG